MTEAIIIVVSSCAGAFIVWFFSKKKSHRNLHAKFPEPHREFVYKFFEETSHRFPVIEPNDGSNNTYQNL